MIRVVHIGNQDIMCASNPYGPYGPNSEIIDFDGEGGDEEIAPPPPSSARGMWEEW